MAVASSSTYKTILELLFVVYLDQLSGAERTRKLVKLLYLHYGITNIGWLLRGPIIGNQNLSVKVIKIGQLTVIKKSSSQCQWVHLFYQSAFLLFHCC